MSVHYGRRHSGIGFMTPAAVHHGHAHALLQQRANTLDIAAWINPPKQEPPLKKTPAPSTLN
jgi:hypothetical protein